MAEWLWYVIALVVVLLLWGIIAWSIAAARIQRGQAWARETHDDTCAKCAILGHQWSLTTGRLEVCLRICCRGRAAATRWRL